VIATMQPDALALAACQVSAHELTRHVAPLLGVSEGEVLDCLCTVPDNILVLLDSPEGWHALGGFVAAQLGRGAPNFQPAVH
jgi:hypothetical protein